MVGPVVRGTHVLFKGIKTQRKQSKQNKTPLGKQNACVQCDPTVTLAKL